MRLPPLLATALVALLAGCAGAPAADVATTGGAPSAPPPRELPPPPYEFTTAILDNEYQHPRLDAFVQTTIRWWNVDNETHSVVSDDGQFPGSGPIAPHGDFFVTFQRAGDYAFHCRYHPDMRGVVVVR